MIPSIIITILFFTVLSCFFYILWLKFIKKHTRERFAFYGVSVMGGLISLLVIQIYSSQGIISAFINTTNIMFSANISSYKTDFKDHVLTLILFYIMMRFILKIHKNWNGPISEIQYNKQRYNESTTIFIESYLQIKDFLSKEKSIQLHIENEKSKQFNIFSSAEDDKMPWHENVYELLTFSDNQYKIDLFNDYYREAKVFFSKFGQNNDPIAIFCCLEKPNDSSIRNFILFCKKQGANFVKYIVAIKNEVSDPQIVKWNNIDLFYRYEQEMLNSLVDFSSYQQFIKDQFTSKEITFGSGIALKDIYIELKAKNDNGISIDRMEKYIFDWLEIKNENKHLAILGEYGCGKSVLSLKITHELLQNRTPSTRIPILIELRGRSPRNLDVTDIFSMWASKYRLDASSLLKLHKAGKLLIIFEGFDEMDMIGDREMRLNHFQRLWELALPKSKIIITGRPNFFLDDKELKANLGIDKPYETSHYCEAIHLEKFTTEQIKQALRNIEKNTQEQVIEILEKPHNTNFYDLVSRPAILYLVSVIWKERKLSEIKDNINSAIVISEFIQYSYSRQSNKPTTFPLSEKEREFFMLGVAVGMHRITEFSNQISKDELENIILKLYKHFPDEITPIQNATQQKRKLLKERMIDNNKAEETILTDVRSCGILVNDLTRKDYFKFAHKSFLEYQVSQYFVESILQDKGEYNIVMNAISNALDITTYNFNLSQETIFFTAEILISKLKLNNNTDSENICRQLFKILYPNKILSKYPKIAAYYDMYLPSQLLSFVLILFMTYFLTKNLVFNEKMTLEIPFGFFVILTFFVGYTFFIYKRLFNKSSIKRTSIWLKCCNQLNISESVVCNIVPQNYILYLNGKYSDPFTIFLRKAVFSQLIKK